MNARGLLISLNSAPKTHLLTTTGKSTLHSKSRPAPFQLCPCQTSHLRRGADGSAFIWRLRRVRADVKSEQYDIVESAPDSVRLDQDLPTDDDVAAAADLPWWEEFPKRWVIVLLCFSAFLLCNMDRVIN